MKYLNIDLSTLRSPEYIGSAPIERGTWLSVLGYCADQENGGRIVGAMTWKDRQWQQVCGVTLREVRSATRLLLFEGDDVIVFDYPLYLEEEIRNRRASGRAGGQARAKSKAQAEPKECLKHNQSRTQGVLEAHPQAEPKECLNVREGKVREGKVREGKVSNKDVGENETAADAAPTSAELVLGDVAKAAKPEKQTDAQWLAGIKADPAFAGIDVEREHAKCIRWCSENGKQQTRRRFINWLNRCDRPIGAVVSAAQQRSEELSKANGYEY